MSDADVYWVSHRDTQGNLLCCPAYLNEEGETVTFKEYGTDVEFTDQLGAIQGTVADPESLDVVPEDLVESDEVNETAVLWSIKKKFKDNVIYTSIGTILIAMNPYRVISSLYTKEKLDVYKNEAMHSRGIENFDTSPHIWSVARSAYVHLLKQAGKRQAIIISGESGAGKTEATKKIMTFLSYVSTSSTGTTAASSTHQTERDEKEAIEHKVLMTNPLLESFGNAKTSRNDNSSRFGKWLEIVFHVTGAGGAVKLSGAHIVHYLLEKSRVVSQAKGERNFHIFYQLFSHDDLKLGNIGDYLYLNTSGCTMIKGVNDGASGKDTQKSLDDLNVSRDNQRSLYIALKGILCLGNIQMETVREDDDLATCTASSKQALKNVADSFGLNAETLENALATKKITAGADTTEVHLTPVQTAEARNALAKEVYNRLFTFIVETANLSLEQHVGGSGSQQDKNEPASRSAFTTSVGLLDIFGFEIFALNSLEQLSINFANEKLQQYFLHYVLKREQEIYETEGIDCERIIPPDNQDLIDLFETPQTGIFARLNEEVKLPKGSDGSLLRKVVADQAAARKKLDESEDPGDMDVPVRFVKDVKMAVIEFSINHFAGTVCYSAEGFVEKNKDRLFDHLDALLQGSSNRAFARMMGSEAKTPSGSSSSPTRKGGAPVKKLTIIQGFTAQLSSLMEVLGESNPHFVRCIKPNETKSSAIFNEDLVLQQLRYSGVLEAIQIRKKGFPVRRLHREFHWLYGPLCESIRADLQSSDLSDHDKCELVVGTFLEEAADGSPEVLALFEHNIAIGKTMVFYRHNLLKHLEHRRHELRVSKIPILQRFGRMARAICWVRALRKGVAELDVLIKGSMEHEGRNYQVHDELKQKIFHCEEALKMLPLPVLKLAKERLQMLETVKDLMDEVHAICEPGADAKYDDILAMHDKARGLLDAAAQLGFKGPDGPSDEVNRLFRLELSVATKANLLRRLRTAISAAKEDDIRDCLTAVEELSLEEDSSTKLFSDEQEIASKILAKIEADNARIKQAVEVCATLHREGDRALSDRSSPKLLEFQKGVIETLISFKTDPPAGEATSQFISLMRDYGAVLAAWKEHKWDECAETARNVKKALGSLGSEGSGKLGSPVLLSALTDTVEPLGHAILHRVVPDIETNLSLPQLGAAVVQGPVTAGPCLLSKILVGSQMFIRTNSAHDTGLRYFHIDRAAISYDELDSAIESVEAMELGSEEGLAMLPMLKALVNVRRYLAEGQWMDVLRQAYSKAEMEAWEQYYTAVAKRLRDAVDVSGAAMSAFPDPDLVPFVQPNDDRFLNEFFSMANVTREFEVARDYAQLQLIYESLIAPLMEGSAISTEDEVVGSGGLDAIMAEGSFTEDSTSSLAAFVAVLGVLKEMRTGFAADDSGAWSAVIAREAQADWNDLSYSHLEEADLQSRQDTPMLQCVALVKDELAHIVRHAKSKVAERDLRAAFKVGNYRGSHETVSFVSLEAVVEATPSDNMLNPYAGALLNVALMLVRARKIFSRKDFDAPMAKRVVDSLSTYLADKAAEANLSGAGGSSMSMASTGNMLLSSESIASRRRSSEYIQSMVQVPELVTELQHMHSDIDFADCLSMIEEGLQLPSPVTYVVPISKGTSGSQETDYEAKEGGDNADGGDNKADSEDAKGKSADAAPPLPPVPPDGPSPTPADPARFLAADGLTLNKAALNTQKLNAGLDVAKEATKYIKNVLPKHMRVIRCAEFIKKMRDNVRIGNWIEAFQAFSAIKEAELLTTVPLIQAEVVGAADTICNYYVIIVCRKALSSGFARGKIGLVDKKKIDPGKLDDAHHTCAEIGCTNERALALREAVWLMAELRRAQSGGNWTSINEVMKKIEDAGIGNLKGYTDCCYEEVSWAKIERDNHDVTMQVMKAIVEEALQHKDSSLDIPAVKVAALQAAYLRGTAIKEKYRGLVLVEVLSLADIVLKARKAVQQANWFALNSLTALWTAEVEEFQMQMESLEVGDHSKHRGGSILRRSSVIGAASFKGGIGEPPSRKAEKKFNLWPLFSKVKDRMTLELLYIEQHFAIQELELEINTALRTGGMTAEMVGDVDTKNIDLELITAAISKRKQLEGRGMSLSGQLKSVFNAAAFILKVRAMVQNEEWDGMRAHLEESMTQNVSGLAITLPDICRKELEYVRHESENRWIIGSMESAVKSGQMKGTVDEVDIDSASFSHLVPIIGTCQEMTPRTEKAVNLVYTGEALVPLRRIITSRPVDWGELLSQAGSALKPSSVVKLDTLVLPEIRLMEAVASEKLLCTNLSQCISRFGPKGQPGNLDLTHTSTEEIEDAVMMAVNSGVKSIRGSQLLVACRDMVVLRKALLSTRSDDDETSKEGWSTLRRVVMTLFERHQNDCKSQPPSPSQSKDEASKTATEADADKANKQKEGEDAGWAICKNEVDFISRDAHVEEVRMNLESNIKKTIAVYQLRTQVPCDPLEDHQVLNKASRKHTDGSYSIHVEVLTKILEYAEGLDFDNAILTRYRKVCMLLKAIRTCVIGDDFKDLKKMLFADKTAADLMAVPSALEELQCAKMEFQNEAGIHILEASIRFTKHGHEHHHEAAHGVDYAKTASYQLSTVHADMMRDYCRVHGVPESQVSVDPHSLPPVTQPYLFMYVAIRIVQQSVPAYLMLKELLDCAVHVYQLRVGFASGESKEVSSALKWLRGEGTHCPRQLQNEARIAYVDHKNNLLRERLTTALQTGRASHLGGEVDVSTVETQKLRLIIEQAKEFKSSLTLDMMALVEAAESLLVLRKAQKEGDLVGLHDYLQLLAEYNRSHARKLHNMIIDEVASMLRSLHNEMSQVALRCSLDAFVKQNHKPLPGFLEEPGAVEESFLQIVGNNVYYEYVRSCAAIKGSGGRTYPTMHDVGSADYIDNGGNANETEDPDRHYCYDNIHRSDVSVLTIDTTLFDEALMISKEKGVYGSSAKRLLRTVLMMRSIRIAMRRQDWHKVDSILTKNSITLRSSAPFDPAMLPTNLDRACALEIYVIQHQLEMRAAILDVFDCLKRGWARCSNGIVDSSTISVEELESAVRRSESSIEDAQSESASEMKTDNTATATGAESQQEKIFSLLRSASIVSKARRLLLVGMLKEAGELASAAVNIDKRDEPPLYQLSAQADAYSTSSAELMSLVGDKKVHEAVLDELQLYAAEVHCALKLADLVSILREGITDGDSQELETLIQDSQSMMMQQSLRLNDLGLVRVLQRAQMVYRTLQRARKVLLKCTHSHDKQLIEKALDNARKLRLKDADLIAATEDRLRKLTELDAYMLSLSAPEGGIISSTAKFRLAAHKAVKLDLSLHPDALLAEVGKHLKYSSLRRLHLAQALSLPASSRIALDSEGRELGFNPSNYHVESDADRPFTLSGHGHGLPYAAATHTMRIKRAYLGHPSVRRRYKLHQFPPLRDPARFSLRMGVANQSLQQTMLSFQETNLPTSITALRPELAALSVWIFAHVIRGLENSTFTRIEVRLRDMARLGREIPSMRDELLLQLVKQLGNNPHPNNTDRLWRCLACSLAHFPPSSEFENYLELHLFETVEGFEKEIAAERATLAKVGEVPVRDTSHLVKSSMVADAMAPVKIHQKDSSLEEKEMASEINDRIDKLRHRLRWARHCVRLLHEGCFLYGNDKAVLRPYDQSLERFLLWLSEPQAVVMMLRCQTPQDDSETPEKWNRILSRQGKRHDDESSPSKGKPDKTVPKALLKVFEDPGWTDDISTQELSHDQASTATNSSGMAAQVDLSESGDDDEEGGMMKMQGTSQAHLTKSAFTMGASLFGKFETIKEEGETRKAVPTAPITSASPSTTSSTAKSGKSNRALYSAFPAKLIADLVGGSGKIYGSHKYWSQAFNTFTNSQSISPEASAILKDKVRQARRSLRASRAFMSTSTSGDGSTGRLQGITEDEEQEPEDVVYNGFDGSDSSDSDDDAGVVRAAHRHLLIQKDTFLQKMCELSLHVGAEGRSLEEEVVCFLLGEGTPTRVAEAVRWYNYNVEGGSSLPRQSPFFSDGENEQSRLRTEWLRENISIPEKETFTLPEGYRSKSESDSDSSGKDEDEDEDEDDEEKERQRAAEEEEEVDPAVTDLARITVNGALFWETVIVPVCRKYGLQVSREDAKDGPSGEAKEQPTTSAKRGSVFASNYIKSLSAKAAGAKVGMDMRLYRDIINTGIILFVQRCRKQEVARASRHSVREQDVVIRFRSPQPPTGLPPMTKVLGNIPDEQGEPTVFHMYTRSKATADGNEAASGGRHAANDTDGPHKATKRASLFVKFAE